MGIHIRDGNLGEVESMDELEENYTFIMNVVANLGAEFNIISEGKQEKLKGHQILMLILPNFVLKMTRTKLPLDFFYKKMIKEVDFEFIKKE